VGVVRAGASAGTAPIHLFPLVSRVLLVEVVRAGASAAGTATVHLFPLVSRRLLVEVVRAGASAAGTKSSGQAAKSSGDFILASPSSPGHLASRTRNFFNGPRTVGHAPSPHHRLKGFVAAVSRNVVTGDRRENVALVLRAQLLNCSGTAQEADFFSSAECKCGSEED